MQISIVSYEKHRNLALEAAEQEYIKRLSRQGTGRPTGPAVERYVCSWAVRGRRTVYF